MPRVPGNERRLFMISASKVNAPRTVWDAKALKNVDSGRPAPPRWLRILETAKAEGLAEKWATLATISARLGRHRFSDAGNEFDMFYREKNQLSYCVSGVANYILGRLGISEYRDFAVLDMSGAYAPDSLEIIQFLKFSLDAHGVIVEKHPATDHTYALVRVLDAKLFRESFRQNWKFENKTPHPRLVSVELIVPANPWEIVDPVPPSKKADVDPASWSRASSQDQVDRLAKGLAELKELVGLK